MSIQKTIRWTRKVQSRGVVAIPPEILKIMGDPAYLDWVFTNGVITVNVSKEEKSHGPIQEEKQQEKQEEQEGQRSIPVLDR